MRLLPLVKTVSTVSVVALSLLSTPVFANPHGAERGGIARLLKQLDLSDQQRQDVQLVLQQNKPDFAADKVEMRQIHEQIKALVESNELDQEALATVIDQQLALTAERKWQRAQTHQQLWALLSVEQQQKWLQSLAEKQAGKPANADKSLHMFKRLQLTDEQKSQLHTLRQQHHETMSTQHQARLAFKQAELELISSGTLTESTWTELYQQYLPQMRAAAIAQVVHRHQLWSVFTPEQQQRWQKMQRKMQDKHHKQPLFD